VHIDRIPPTHAAIPECKTVLLQPELWIESPPSGS
jgi:hypothetical protein